MALSATASPTPSPTGDGRPTTPGEWGSHSEAVWYDAAMSTSSLLATERLRPLKRVEYDRLVELGAFEDERLELIHGMLVAMSPQHPPHAWCVQCLNKLLIHLVGDRAAVRVQLPFVASDDSEPEPDVAVVAALDYSEQHPAEALLIIEVADDSLHRDLNIKPAIYAASGVAEYWVVDLRKRRVHVHRDPEGDSYGSIQRHAADATLTLLAFPDLTLRIADFLP